MPGWWNGRHKGLKIPRPQGVPVRVRLRVPNTGVSTMDSTGDFYSLDVGSIPARRTR